MGAAKIAIFVLVGVVVVVAITVPLVILLPNNGNQDEPAPYLVEAKGKIAKSIACNAYAFLILKFASKASPVSRMADTVGRGAKLNLNKDVIYESCMRYDFN